MKTSSDGGYCPFRVLNPEFRLRRIEKPWRWKRGFLRSLLWFFLFSLFLTPMATAANPLNLSESLQIALRNNHEIKSLQSGVLAGKADIGIAMSYLLPGIYLEERALRTNNPTYAFMAKLNQERFTAGDFALDNLNNPDAITDYQTSLSFQQPLFAPKAFIGFGISQKEALAKEAELQRKREEITYRVVRTYLNQQTAAAFVRVSEQAAKDVREHLRLAELRYQNGLGLYSDVLRASTAVTEAEQRLVTAKKNLAVAGRALGLLLSLPEEVTTETRQPDIPLHELDTYLDAAAQRKDIRALELRRETARDQIRLAESGYLPELGIGGSYQWNDHDHPAVTEGDSWQMAAYLKWDLFSGTRTIHERRKAKHKAIQIDEALAGQKAAVSFSIHEAYLSVDETRKKADLAAAALKTAVEGTRLVRVRYEGALSPLVDLLDAQT
ncbi:MAG: TolC family protein, partial [Syntrophaceae bacterium]|nr:TolC family protein [Syntrophaceae bacterium]